MITIMPAKTPTLAVTREQAVRLFTECRVISVEMVDDFAAWMFPGGVVLVHDHTAEPACFRICLDGKPVVQVAATTEPRTFAPTQRIIGREMHGDRTVVSLECGHYADVPAAEGASISLRCQICEPIEVLRG